MKQCNVVGYLARMHGLNALESLVSSERYAPKIILTHSRLPKSEDPNRSLRPEYSEYKRICEENGIRLYPIDTKKQAEEIIEVLRRDEIDFIGEVSWRRLISMDELNLAKIGAIGLHRGKLPNYPLAEPIKQALENGDEEIWISAHELLEEYDTGRVIEKYVHPTNYDSTKSLEENVSRLKEEITTHFGPLMVRTFEKLIDQNE